MLEVSDFSKISTAVSKRKFLQTAQKIAIVREHLEAKHQQKNNVMTNLLQEHIEPKRTWGDLKERWVPHDVRDQVVNTMRSWS